MKESIKIKNLGPLRNIEIDNIKPLTVLIGESEVGKVLDEDSYPLSLYL